MSGVIIANKDEVITISAPDVYGADFKISIFSQVNSSWELTNEEMREYLDVVDDIKTNIIGDYVIGNDKIEVKDVNGLAIGSIVSLSNYYYRIIGIVNNFIYLHKGLFSDLSDNDELVLEGNMSLYYCNVNIAEPGDYLIRARDSVFGLEIIDNIKVVPKSIETMVKDIKNLEYAILGQ